MPRPDYVTKDRPTSHLHRPTNAFLINTQPVNVGSGNTFQVVGGSGAAAGIQISLT